MIGGLSRASRAQVLTVSPPLEVASGFLLVKRYPVLYREYAPRYHLTHEVYALPRLDRSAEASPIQYRGVDRDALGDNVQSELLAEIRLAELAAERRCADGPVFARDDAWEVFDWLGEDQPRYEIIWGAVVDAHLPVPQGFRSLGYEPSYFISDHFSPSCDCMLFPRWHGTDEEGVLFRRHFERLNECGLFRTPTDAEDFLRDYLALEWTERGTYYMVEVAALEHERRQTTCAPPAPAPRRSASGRSDR